MKATPGEQEHRVQISFDEFWEARRRGRAAIADYHVLPI
jgi:hypothetical protein